MVEFGAEVEIFQNVKILKIFEASLKGLSIIRIMILAYLDTFNHIFATRKAYVHLLAVQKVTFFKF